MAKQKRNYKDLMITPDKEEAEPVAEEKIVLSKAELNALMDSKIAALRDENAALKTQNQGLEKQVGIGDWKAVEDTRKRKHTATFRMWRPDTDQPFALIVDWKHLRYDYDENSRKHDKDIYKLTLLHEDGTKTHTEMSLSEFATIGDVETVEISEKEDTELVKVHGKIRKAAKGRDGATMSRNVAYPGIDVPDGGEWVDLEERKIESSFLVTRKDGQTFRINGNRLNA